MWETDNEKRFAASEEGFRIGLAEDGGASVNSSQTGWREGWGMLSYNGNRRKMSRSVGQIF